MLQLNLRLAVKQICDLVGSSSSKKATVRPATPALAAGPTFSDNRSESLLWPVLVLGPIDQVFENHKVYPSLQPGTNSLDMLTPIHKTKTIPLVLVHSALTEINGERSPVPSPSMQAPRLLCSAPLKLQGSGSPPSTLSLRSNTLITTIASFVPAVEQPISRLGEPAEFPLIGSRKKVDERSCLLESRCLPNDLRHGNFLAPL
jgi:hypothetical protein